MTASLDEWEAAVRARLAAYLNKVKVTIGVMPATPDQCVTVRAYADSVPADPANDIRLIRLQVRCRQAPCASPPTATRLAEAAQAALLGHGLVLALALPRARVTHLATAVLGVDAERRDERTDNYLITTTR